MSHQTISDASNHILFTMLYCVWDGVLTLAGAKMENMSGISDFGEPQILADF